MKSWLKTKLSTVKSWAQTELTDDLTQSTIGSFLQKQDYTFIEDLNSVNPEVRFMLLNDKTKNLSLLESFVNLEALHFIGAYEKAISIVSQLTTLKYLKLGYAKLDDLKSFTPGFNVQMLQLADCRKLISLDGIENLPNLEMLSIENSKRLNSLSGVEVCRNLKVLEVQGGNLDKTKIESLEPLSELTNLEVIKFSTARVLDDRLDFLNKLTNLKTLSLPNYFPTEEYAKLSVHLPQTECSLFEPYIKLGHRIGENDIMVTGKRKPWLNSSKDKERIKKYVADFEKIKLTAHNKT